MTVQVYSDYGALSHAAARLIAAQANQLVAQRGSFSLALAGGHTPARLYELLASAPYRDQIPWDSVHIFWGDERCVPADDPASNQGMARRLLLDRVPLPLEQIYPIPGELPARQAADQYEKLLKDFFTRRATGFDLILLGLGADGHTASLFPRTAALHETQRWVTAVHLNDSQPDRVSLTAPFINLAAQVVFIVSGAGKAQALHMVLEGLYQPEVYPAQLIRPIQPPIWLVDQAAGQKLTGQSIIEQSD